MPGGYREKSGRSKSGYYKGIYCGSTYELCWVIYNIDHNVLFTRFNNKLEKDNIVYYPDFLLDDKKTIIEIKGYENKELVDKKTNLAKSFGYNVIVLYKANLQHIFDYVKQTYKTNKFYQLYDSYKPKYKHICDYCLIEFETDRKIKTTIKFCSRICSGKYTGKYTGKYRNSTRSLKRSPMSELVRNKISKSMTGKKIAPYKRRYKQIWITNGKIITRIKDTDPIPYGFVRGRTLPLP